MVARQPASINWANKTVAQVLQHGRRIGLLAELRYLHARKWLKLLAVFTPSHATFFRRFGLPALVTPMGYDTSFGLAPNGSKDIDVVFLGSLRDARRRHIVTRLESDLLASGVTFVIKDGSQQRGAVHGDERSKLLGRSRIMLNIMRQPWDDLVFRMLLAAPNGCMLVSEPVLDSVPFRSDLHFVSAPITHLPGMIRYYLDHEDERFRVADSAFTYITGRLTMERMTHRVLTAAGLLDGCMEELD